MASSVHQDNVTLHNTQCTRYGYKHPHDNCPAKGKECYNCHGLNHYTALCRCPKQRKNSSFRTTSRPHYGKSSEGRHGSCSPSKHRQSHHRSPSPTNTQRSSHQPRDREAQQDLNKLIISLLVQTLAQKVNYIWMLHHMDKHHSMPHFKW